MTWIHTVPFEEAKGQLKKLYNRVKGPDDNVDNVLMIHSLRPHSLKGHMVLYKSVLHHKDNTLDKWILELLGVYVSHLNGCSYCVDHHSIGLKRLLNNDEYHESILRTIGDESIYGVFDDSIKLALGYAKKLTLDHRTIQKSDIDRLKKAGFTDGEILEINQVVSYFNYVNRTVLGLGVNTDGDLLGLSPNDNDDPDNWSHD